MGTTLRDRARAGTRTTESVLGPGSPDNVVDLSLETMEILRRAGADVDARITDVTSLTARIARPSTLSGRQGQTSLFVAVETGRVGVVRYLLDHGAGANVRDDGGRTPLDVARRSRSGEDQSGIQEIVTLLEQAAAR